MYLKGEAVASRLSLRQLCVNLRTLRSGKDAERDAVLFLHWARGCVRGTADDGHTRSHDFGVGDDELELADALSLLSDERAACGQRSI